LENIKKNQKKDELKDIYNAQEISKIICDHIKEKNKLIINISDNGYMNFSFSNNNSNLIIKKKEMDLKEELLNSKKLKIENLTPKHKLEINLSPSKYIEEEYKLYCKYQIAIHKDKPEELTPRQYENFLVNSPLIFIPPNEDSPYCGYGSFHQTYRIDGKLIAVGVVDILPNCLSSVYFFYDPDYHSLSLGIFSALKEIEWVTNIRQKIPPLKYYYLGFYVHNCPKMRYKGQYEPSDLLCSETYEWVPLSECIPKLDKKKYINFSVTFLIIILLLI
jgi:arginine-tRNA-protein transferase